MPNHPSAPATEATNQPDAGTGLFKATGVNPWRELTVPLAAGGHAAVGALRHLAHSALSVWGIAPGQAEDVVLVLSELATNALRHTEGPAEIRLHACEDQLVLDVADTSTSLPDFVTGPDDDDGQPHGFGLALIAASLADTLTVTREPGRGKTVTATFAIKDVSRGGAT
jgi:anti-sigma regulatory factor (Ser/Thr protein kinase)